MAPPATHLRAFGCDGTLAVTDPRALPVALRQLSQLIDDVDRACSRFRDDSELVGLSRAAGTTTQLSPLLAAGLRVSLNVADATEGLVDPTIGASLRYAGYDRDLAAINARPDDISPVPASGWRTIELDDDSRMLSMPPGSELDLGAIGKAWAADLAARQIADTVSCGVLVSFGGDVSVAGAAPTNGWVVRVTETPGDTQSPGQTITIDEGGLATSSTQLRRWKRGQRVCHHILDPATGLPAPVIWRTVTVAASSCVDANAASTAAVILGADAPRWLTERELPARLVHVDGGVVTVGGWPDEITAVSA